MEETPAITDEAIQYASQAHILKVMGQMGCEDGYKSSVRTLPHIDVRNQIQYASELDAASVERIENVFRRGIKALARMLLPGLNLKCDSDIKTWKSPPLLKRSMKSLSCLSLLPASQRKCSTPCLSVAITIRDVLKCKKPYTSIDARILASMDV